MEKPYWIIHWIRQRNLAVVQSALRETLIFMEKVDSDRQASMASDIMDCQRGKMHHSFCVKNLYLVIEVVSNALKKGGKHFMDIMNSNYAETHFPCKLWDEGEKCLTLSAFEWDKKSKILLYGQVDYPYGEPLWKLEMKEGNPIRLYTISEISKIFSTLGMSVCKSYADYTGKPSSDNDIQLMVYSVRN